MSLVSLNVLNDNPTGYLVYDGPSQLDGSPIICVATVKTTNAKTGDMIQTWILRKDMAPLTAIANNEDDSICGDCKHRGSSNGKRRSCYVSVYTAPTQVYKAFIAEKYPRANLADIVVGRKIRFGSYGDPAALPLNLLLDAAKSSDGYTAYTHSWKKIDPEYRQICMASVDSREEYLLAKCNGWRTFRTRLSTHKVYSREFICPASEEDDRLTCENCLACCGTHFDERNKAGDVCIVVHGSPAAIRSYEYNRKS